MEKDAAGAREEADERAGQLRRMKEQITTYKATITQLEDRLKEMMAASAGAPGDAAAAGGASGDAAASEGKKAPGFMKNLAKMFTDPKMKDLMRAQQGTAINMMYRISRGIWAQPG